VRFDNAVISTPRASRCVPRAGALLLLTSAGCGALPMNVGALGADFWFGRYKWLQPYGHRILLAKNEHPKNASRSVLMGCREGAENFHSLSFENPKPSRRRRWDMAETSNYFNSGHGRLAPIRFPLDPNGEAHNRN